MRNVTIPYSPPKVKTQHYRKFKGVDFSTDPSLVDERRSPDGVNMISDSGGMPVKRAGWRTLWQLSGQINCLSYGVIGQETVFLCHAGDKLYRWYPQGEGGQPKDPQLLREGLADRRSTIFTLGERMWILTGEEYLCYGLFEQEGQEPGEGEAPQETMQTKDVADIAYVPTTIIAREPAGGGTVYENVNLLQPRRKNSFLADGAAKAYQLDSVGLDDTPVTAVVNGSEMAEGEGFTVDRETGTVTFTTAPAKSAVDGMDNVVITFAKTVEGYAGRITGCTIAAMYGVGTTDRVFVSGNAQYRNMDWYSGLGDPTYFSDLSYSNVGVEGTAIMGYRNIGEYQAIIKEDNGQDATVFLRSASVSDVGVAFPLKQGVSGVGAISPRGFVNLGGEQMFLSGTGMYAITSNAVTSERVVSNRTYFINARLTNEEGLADAAAIEWKGYAIICVGGHAYVLDGNQNKAYIQSSYGDYTYECYYWENFPARRLMNYRRDDEQTLWFGTADGRICRLNDDIEGMARYADDGQAIVAVWSTKADDDGDPTVYKTMIKKGCAVTLKPYTRSSVQVIYRTDRDLGRQVRYGTMDIFDWEDIDFGRFTFNANDGPQEVLFKKRCKKYKRLQIILRNDAVNEGFGVYGVTKHYTVGNYTKR